MKFELITLFLLLINTIENAVLSSNSVKPGEKNFENEFYQKAFKELGIALQNETLTDQHQETLDILGKAIIDEKLLDKNHLDDFKLLGKAIVGKKLNKEAKKLLGELLEHGRNEKTYAKLRKILNENDTSSTLNKQRHSESQENKPISASHKDIKNGQESSSVVDNDALKSLSEVLKKLNFSEENQDKVLDLIVQALENKKLLNGENQENSNLVREALTLRKFLDGKYPKTLKLLGDAIDLNQISEDRIKEILKDLSVFITTNPSDDDALNQLAEMLVKNERSANNVPKPQASTTVVSQEPPRPLLDGPVNESNGNQGSYTENTRNQTTSNDGLPNEQDSTTAGQNNDSGAMETTKSPKLKRRNKRSTKYNGKSNSDSLQSKDKSKEPQKKSSKKNKRSRRKTKDVTESTSKNKHKRSKRKKSKEKTAISGHDGESNSKDIDTDMMGDDPNTYNASAHSEAPFTQTASAKPAVVDVKTNAPLSISNNNDNSKLFNSYYPEEYKRFVPLNPAIAYRRPKLLFMNDDNPIIPKLKTVVGKQSQGKIFEDDDMKPQTPVNFPKNRLVLTFTVSRSVY